MIPQQCKCRALSHDDPGTAVGSSNDVMSFPGLGFTGLELRSQQLFGEGESDPGSFARVHGKFFFFPRRNPNPKTTMMPLEARGPSACSRLQRFFALSFSALMFPSVSSAVRSDLGCVLDPTSGLLAHISPTRRALIRPREPRRIAGMQCSLSEVEA